jgi:hypothetical protein
MNINLEEIIKNADLAAGLDLDMLEEYEEMDEEIKDEPKKDYDKYHMCDYDKDSDGHKEYDNKDRKDYKCYVPSMKIDCNLEVSVGNKNKIIYVCPGKLQYFTASAISCSGDETIEIEYCGDNKKYVFGETFICGFLGYYKIVKSGIIFIPRRNLSEFPDDWFPTDILKFKAKSKCSKDVEFVVVFTYSRCVDC